ncbi:MAG TPA: MaoC/PaaZ C-terminal domain-containing protein [Rhizobiaceae bacterium]|nr:MaoC/PaaZ C-terminal domain-containing protein [Rhizobiaceae bacterium]
MTVPNNVGDAIPELSFGPITRSTLALYAGASGDHVKIHIDSDFAKAAGRADVFAHGMLSMAQLGRLVTNWAGIDRLRSLQCRFEAITNLGDTVRCSGTVVERFQQNGETCLRLAVSAQVDNGTRTLLGEAVVAVDPAD